MPQFDRGPVRTDVHRSTTSGPRHAATPSAAQRHASRQRANTALLMAASVAAAARVAAAVAFALAAVAALLRHSHTATLGAVSGILFACVCAFSVITTDRLARHFRAGRR